MKADTPSEPKKMKKSDENVPAGQHDSLNTTRMRDNFAARSTVGESAGELDGGMKKVGVHSTATAVLESEEERDEVKSSRLLLSSGSNSAGQLGMRGGGNLRRHTETSRRIFRSDSNELVDLSVSSLHTLFVQSDGVVWTAGSNEFGQLGRSGESGSMFRPLQSLTQQIVQVCAGDRFSLAVSGSGKLFSWGLNDSGQLGQGHRNTVLKPKPVKDIPGNKPIRKVVCGAQHVLAVCNGGQLLVWGSSRFGQLGNGSYVSSVTPQMCKFLTNEGIKDIATGHSHCLALTSRNTLYVWGRNDFGQLGLGDQRNRLRPVEVTQLRVAKLAKITAGSFHSVAVSHSNIVFAWGQGHRGQLGVGTDAPRIMATPTLVEALRDTKIVSVAAGLAHTYFLSDKRRLYVSGDNSCGQLGQPMTSSDSTGAGGRQLFLAPARLNIDDPSSSHLVLDQVFCGGNSSFLYFSTDEGISARMATMSGIQTNVTIGAILRKLEALVTQKSGQHQITALRKAILTGFSSIAILNECTPTPSGEQSGGSSKVMSGAASLGNIATQQYRPDFATLRKVYKFIDEAGKIDSAIPQTLGRALTKLVAAMETYRPSQPEELVCFHALFECPLLLSGAHTYYTVLDALLRALVKQPQKLRRLFVEGCETYGSKHAHNVVQCVQNLITESAIRGSLGAQVWRAASLLADIRRYRQHFSGLKLAPEMFYNTALSERTDLEQEFRRWSTQGNTVFTVCQFPFLLNPEAKRRLLQAEAHQYMSTEVAGARRRQFRRLQQVLQAASVEGVESVESVTAAAAEAVHAENPHLLRINVRRKFLLNDTLRELQRVMEMNQMHQMKGAPINELQKPLIVHFIGEEGVDEGGLRKEFFQLILKELLQPVHVDADNTSVEQVGLFKWLPEVGRYWFWPEKKDPPGAEGWLRNTMAMLGTLFGLAAYNGVLLDAPVPNFLYEMIVDGGVLVKSGLNQKLSFLSQIAPSLASSLKLLMKMSDEDLEEVDQTFQIEVQTLRDASEASDGPLSATKSNMVQRQIDLKPKGAKLQVNGGNRREFVELYCDYMLEKSIASQLQPFRAGFLQVVGGQVVALCTAEELALLTSGYPLSETDGFKDLERITRYKGYTKDSPVVRWFWQMVHRASDEWKRRFFQFATGTDRVPLQGFKSIPFIIQRAGDDQAHLPGAHTCFNLLDLPDYETPAILQARFDTALEHVHGFGLI